MWLKIFFIDLVEIFDKRVGKKRKSFWCVVFSKLICSKRTNCGGFFSFFFLDWRCPLKNNINKETTWFWTKHVNYIKWCNNTGTALSWWFQSSSRKIQAHFEIAKKKQFENFHLNVLYVTWPIAPSLVTGFIRERMAMVYETALTMISNFLGGSKENEVINKAWLFTCRLILFLAARIKKRLTKTTAQMRRREAQVLRHSLILFFYFP